jgi:hypothetical protein
LCLAAHQETEPEDARQTVEGEPGLLAPGVGRGLFTAYRLQAAVASFLGQKGRRLAQIQGNSLQLLVITEEGSAISLSFFP